MAKRVSIHGELSHGSPAPRFCPMVKAELSKVWKNANSNPKAYTYKLDDKTLHREGCIETQGCDSKTKDTSGRSGQTIGKA